MIADFCARWPWTVALVSSGFIVALVSEAAKAAGLG